MYYFLLNVSYRIKCILLYSMLQTYNIVFHKMQCHSFLLNVRIILYLINIFRITLLNLFNWMYCILVCNTILFYSIHSILFNIFQWYFIDIVLLIIILNVLINFNKYYYIVCLVVCYCNSNNILYWGYSFEYNLLHWIYSMNVYSIP